GVGDRDDRAFEDGGVRGDSLLDLDAGYVLAAGDDDVFAAIAQFDIAVGMPHGKIPGMEPAAGERLAGGGLVVVIAAHDVVAAHDHLAHRLPILGDVVHLRVGHTHEVGRDISLPLAGEVSGALFGRELAPGLLLWADGDRAVGFGQAVDVHDPEVQLVHAGEQRRGGRSGRHHRGHRPVPGVRPGVVPDHKLDRGCTVIVGHAFGVDELPGEFGVHRAHGHMSRRDRGDGPGEAPAVAVEHRQRPQVYRVGAHAGVDYLAECVQVCAAVGVL